MRFYMAELKVKDKLPNEYKMDAFRVSLDKVKREDDMDDCFEKKDNLYAVYEKHYSLDFIAITNSFNDEHDAENYFAVANEHNHIITVAIISKDSYDKMLSLLKKLTYRIFNISKQKVFYDIGVREITLRKFNSLLTEAYDNNNIDNKSVLEDYGVISLMDEDTCYGINPHPMFDENIIKDLEKDAAYKRSKELLFENDLVPELDRIFEGRKLTGMTGHPVHYLITADNSELRYECSNLLLSALYLNERIENRRYTFVDINPRLKEPTLEALYKSSDGGAVILRFEDEKLLNDSDIVSAIRRTVRFTCGIVKKYQNKVLTLLWMPTVSTRSQKIFCEYLSGMTLVKIKEDLVSGERARAYLSVLARDNKARKDKYLYEMVKENVSYHADELHEMFEKWFREKLKTKVYPQYSELYSVNKTEATSRPKGFAYDEFESLIGLGEAKKIINDALNYHKAQKIFKSMGIENDRMSMHMVFTGNPGTAKTTVARLFASIMKENEVLSSGHLVECGRGDLVAEYVGQTAKAVQEKFDEAMGGVLFIDEAYSLVDDKDGCFGDEAINTIVQEMENRRDDVAVVFAGYPDKMEGFLKKNPGLRSRIAFHVHFDDYDTDNLLDIAKLMADKKGLTISEDAYRKLYTVFDIARENDDFGNGRYVRNVLEKAKMAQCSRLLRRRDIDKITKKDALTILAEDIDMPEERKAAKTAKIGFCA